MSDAREGLPPGVREACFDGRLALLLPPSHGPPSHGFRVSRLVLGEAGELFKCLYADGSHHEIINATVQDLRDDEVDAAFERGAEWVRTGEMA